MFPWSIHLDTIQHSNDLGATPSIRKTFGWFIRLDMITSLQYFWNFKRTSGQKPPMGEWERGLFPYLLQLRSVVLVHPEHLNGEHIAVRILTPPNVGKSARLDGVFACREGRFDFVRVRE
jgi:hypothetical protein